MALKPENSTRQLALKDKSEEKQLSMLAHFALVDFSKYYEKMKDARQYEVNKLLHWLGRI